LGRPGERPAGVAAVSTGVGDVRAI
jgi:hypothetical protein